VDLFSPLGLLIFVRSPIGGIVHPYVRPFGWLYALHPCRKIHTWIENDANVGIGLE
jgi:hypothetical protein